MEFIYYNLNICINCGIDYCNLVGEIVSIKRFIFFFDWVIICLCDFFERENYDKDFYCWKNCILNM